MKVVRCNSCGKWIGWENELDVVQTDAKDEEGEYIDYESCPICGSVNGLMDLDTGCSFDESEVSVLSGLFEQMELHSAYWRPFRRCEGNCTTSC